MGLLLATLCRVRQYRHDFTGETIENDCVSTVKKVQIQLMYVH